MGTELRRMLDAGAIDRPAYAARRATWAAARTSLARLTGTRRAELGAVVANLRDIAARGYLTVSRLEPLFLTLARNRQWWTTGPLLSPGRRVAFKGSRLVWQYYPSQGIELQMLASWAKANAFWVQGRDDWLTQLVGELVPLAARRGDGIAWEYYFRFGGGRPPWTSAMSQGTALQALGRAALRLGTPELLDTGRAALALFRERPPVGVRVRTSVGDHYLLYSFAPGQRVLNGFAQALVGLYDYGELTDDARARELFAAGDAEARAEVPRYDTGAWSLYQPGRESDLGYHRLVRGFLRTLCERTEAPVYCTTARRFSWYLREAPRVALRTRRVRAGRVAELDFSLSKVARVGLTVRRGDRTVFATSAQVGYGQRGFLWRPPRAPGAYTVVLRATDLAGNVGRAEQQVEVLRAHRVRHRRGRRASAPS